MHEEVRMPLQGFIVTAAKGMDRPTCNRLLLGELAELTSSFM